jgi:hypothetical protein
MDLSRFPRPSGVVDIALTGSQKGPDAYLRPSPSCALRAARPRSLAKGAQPAATVVDWRPIPRGPNKPPAFFPYTPATLLLFGLREALDILLSEGLENVFRGRHRRLAVGVRAAVGPRWRLANLLRGPRRVLRTRWTAVVSGMGARFERGPSPRSTAIDSTLSLRRRNIARLARKGLSASGILGSLNELEVLDDDRWGSRWALRECRSRDHARILARSCRKRIAFRGVGARVGR